MGPLGRPFQTRAVSVAKNGMVASSHPLATQWGVEILKAGGNAVDAAIAVNAMLGVVEPMSCGIGGDLFALIWDQGTQRLHGLNASGRAPAGVSASELRAKGNLISTYGPDSWTVPGCVRGWQSLLTRFGSQPMNELLRLPVSTALEGFPVTEVIAGYWLNAENRLRQSENAARTFLPTGNAPRFGELFRNPFLAETYAKLAQEGLDCFYSGSIAADIVAFSQQAGGCFRAEDFLQQDAEWVEPLSTSYRGYDVWQIPPNGQGIAVLQMLNILETMDICSFGFGSAEHLHALIEAKRLVYADRATFYADRRAMRVSPSQLISKAYGRSRAGQIRKQAASDFGPGVPDSHSDTVYLTVVDKDRNACSLIQSLFHGFGSQLVPGQLGFPLQNRGAGFSLDPDHPNCIEPGKRPFHTIIPGMVTLKGQPWLSYGVMGGDMQPQGQVQVLINLIDFGMNLQAAGDAPRIQHFGSAGPNGERSQGKGTVFVETGIAESVLTELRQRGHVVSSDPAQYGGYQAVLIDHEHGVLQGATESRKDGVALGY